MFVVILQTKLLGQMLYYVLTTGSGQQTLGEEYCDITQVSKLHFPFNPCLMLKPIGVHPLHHVCADRNFDVKE